MNQVLLPIIPSHKLLDDVLRHALVALLQQRLLHLRFLRLQILPPRFLHRLQRLLGGRQSHRSHSRKCKLLLLCEQLRQPLLFRRLHSVQFPQDEEQQQQQQRQSYRKHLLNERHRFPQPWRRTVDHRFRLGFRRLLGLLAFLLVGFGESGHDHRWFFGFRFFCFDGGRCRLRLRDWRRFQCLRHDRHKVEFVAAFVIESAEDRNDLRNVGVQRR